MSRLPHDTVRVLATLGACLVVAAPAHPEEVDAETSCPYLRLSLSTPQRVLQGAGDDTLQAEFLGVFGLHLARAGFDVREPTVSRFSWEIFSQVEPLGNGELAWSYALLPMPGLVAGVIEFPTFSVIDRGDGERVRFTTYHGLEHLSSTEFPLRAALASEKLANLYLPVALKLCSERGVALELEEARLKRIRSELSAEIERISAKRLEQSKHIELQVDDGPTDSPSQ